MRIIEYDGVPNLAGPSPNRQVTMFTTEYDGYSLSCLLAVDLLSRSFRSLGQSGR